MAISPLAGKPVPKEMLIDPSRLEHEYCERHADLDDPNQLVSFGTRRFAPMYPKILAL
jgi:phosphoglucomutase